MQYFVDFLRKFMYDRACTHSSIQSLCSPPWSAVVKWTPVQARHPFSLSPLQKTPHTKPVFVSHMASYFSCYSYCHFSSTSPQAPLRTQTTAYPMRSVSDWMWSSLRTHSWCSLPEPIPLRSRAYPQPAKTLKTSDGLPKKYPRHFWSGIIL